MVKVKPFAAIRPPKSIVEEVAARPYDVLNSQEAKAEAGEKSLLHITKPEIDFDPIIDEHSQPAYDKAVENFKKWQEKGWLVQDKKECYYVQGQGGGPHDPRPHPECQHRARILRLSRQHRDQRHREEVHRRQARV